MEARDRRLAMPGTNVRISVFLMAWMATTAPCEVAASKSPATAAQPNIRFHRGASARDIPFTYEQMHIIVNVKVGEVLEIPMLLDTGFGFEGAILLDPALGEKLGLKYTSEVPLGGGGVERPMTARVALGADLSLPGVTFSGQQLLVVTDAAPYVNYPARGIIGKTLFNCTMEIDYDAGVLQLYGSETYSYNGTGEMFDFEFSHGIPVIDASVSIDNAEERPVRMLVDTGAAQLLLFTFSRKDLREPPAVIEGSEKILSRGFAGTVRGSTGRIHRLRLGKHALDGVITSFPDEKSWGSAGVLGQNGMIGNDVLKRFLVVFDYPRHCLYLEPGRRFADPFDWDMAGVITERTSEGRLEVIDVVVGSPASECGIRPGDAIIAVDGRAVARETYDEVWNEFIRDGARVNLTVDRGGVKLEKTLVLRRMI
jgi:predicted aspartyl protease